MEKLPMLLLIFHSIIIGIAHGYIAQEPEAVESWFKNLPYAKEKVAKLHFFFHDTVGGKSTSAITVAQANTTPQSPTGFGLVRIMDDALTVGPEPNSKNLGGSQGIYASASMEDIGLLMTLNFVFTNGKYNGSTLSVLGYNPILHEYRELAIVGGVGCYSTIPWHCHRKNCSVYSYHGGCGGGISCHGLALLTN